MRIYNFIRCESILLSCIAAFYGLVSTSVNADALVASSISFKDATQFTLERNPQLYRYTFISEAQRARQSSSALRPPLNLELEVENFAGSDEFAGVDSAEFTIALSSVIELGGKRSARMNLAEARVNRVLWEQQAETLDVLGEMTAIYIEGLAIQNNIVLAKESLNLSRSLLSTIQKRAQRGAAPEAEVMRAQAAVSRSEIRVKALSQGFERKKVLLAQYWGESAPKFEHLEGDLFELGPAIDFNQLYIRLQNSPAIQVFASSARIVDAELALARANNRSDFTWRAGVKRMEESGESALTASISVPLFSEKRNRGDVRAALAERNRIDYANRDSRIRLRAKLFEAWSLRKQNIEAARKIQSNTIPALVKALQLTRQAYENGRYRYSDLIVAQEELLAAKQARIDLATTALLSQAMIEQLTGNCSCVAGIRHVPVVRR